MIQSNPFFSRDEIEKEAVISLKHHEMYALGQMSEQDYLSIKGSDFCEATPAATKLSSSLQSPLSNSKYRQSLLKANKVIEHEKSLK